MGRLPTNADFPAKVKLSIVPRKYVRSLPLGAIMEYLPLSCIGYAHAPQHMLSRSCA